MDTSGSCSSSLRTVEYVKVNGKWKMKSTGYTRIFEENWDRDETKGLNLVAVNDFSLSADSV